MIRTGTAGRVAVGLTAASLALAACGGEGSSSGDGPGTYKIGLVTSSAGPFASNAKTMEAGAEYAVKLLNEAGGVKGAKLELVKVDSQNKPATTATLIPQLATKQKVLAIVGPVDSAGCEVACATANKLKVPIVSPGAARPGVLKNARPYGFTIAQPDADNSTPVLTKIIQGRKLKRAAIISDEANATTKAQADLFRSVFGATGVQVVKSVTFKSGDSSFASQVTSVASAKPDVLALAAGPDDAGRIAREVRSQRQNFTLLGTGSLQSGGAAYVAAGGQATEGTLAAAQYDPHSATPAAKALLEKAQAATGQADISLNFAYAFDAVHMIAKAIEEKGVKPGDDAVTKGRVDVQESLNAMQNYQGMADATTFKDGIAQRPQLQAVVKDGKFVIDKSAG
ncbi:amino acid ABC transporter substrate-binding protein [Actinomadura sp. KC216]|uniref:ABC transporter substrate-binding protein n=1 Tax=Actinomadura sp. KC216 TaxID=2530370 RepID=UPI00104CCB6F|nr:ABC transporter substrate-binding protein [Actinomadura sp. KC216]TDB89834.1 amino acid ABC transporter substrate-binding protein [Actinomadura sp. KC216]